MKRRDGLRLLGAALLAVGTWSCQQGRADGESSRDPTKKASLPHPPTEQRIVSLSPALTDTLVAIGAEKVLVGVSQFCSLEGRPRVGTAITPQFERIATLAPSLIVATSVAGSRRAELERLARTVDLPWLTLEAVALSTRTLGGLAGYPNPANALADRLERELAPQADEDAPRVLALLGELQQSELYYVRPDSLHGNLLVATGFRNAIGKPTTGPPRLSIERLLELDPDGIVVFRDGDDDRSDDALLASLKRLQPLRAVQEGTIAVYAAPGLLSMGPGILDHLAPLETLLRGLFASTRGAQEDESTARATSPPSPGDRRP